MSSLEPRAWRALGAVGLAVVVVIAVGMAYLRPWQWLASASAPSPPVKPQTVAPVRDMQFLSATLGWAVTEDPGSSALYHTTDGGRHWQRQLQVLGSLGRIGSFRFFDARHGFVYSSEGFGQLLRRTGDGGQHWTSLQLPGPVPPNLLFFADPDHGWCLVTLSPLSVSGPIMDRQQIALFHTTDGGATWRQLLRTDDRQPVSHGLGDDGVKAWIWFRDLRTGWIGQTTPGARAVVYGTADGGDEWTRQELPPPDGGWGSSDGTTALAPPAGSKEGSALLDVAPIVSIPNGWTVREAYLYVWAPTAATWTGPTRLPGPGPVGIEVVVGGRWWASGGSDLLATDDAGDHWRVIGRAPADLLFVRLAVTDANHAWAVLLDTSTCQVGGPCRTSLARSVDGGQHWATVSVHA